MRVYELAKAIGDADAFACDALRRRVSRTSFRAWVSSCTAYRIRRPPPVFQSAHALFQTAVTEQIRARFKTVGPESPQSRVTSVEDGSKGVHHGRVPVFGGVKKTTVSPTAARGFERD